VADDVGLVGRRVDNGGAIDFSINMTRRYPTLIWFGGGYRVDCATAGRSVALNELLVSVHCSRPFHDP
jgi:hypothetical protein